MLASYLIRLGVVALKSAWAPKAGLLEEHRLPMRVWLSDIDTYGHLNNGRFLTLMDFGRWSYSLRTSMFREAVRRKWRPLIAAATIQFRKELGLFRRFELTTRLAYWDERSFYFEHRLELADKLFAQAYVRGVNKSGKRTVPPSAMLQILGHEGPPPEAPRPLLQWIQSNARPPLEGGNRTRRL